MTKYKISGEINNRLDLCDHCGEVWIDSGEWQLLAALDLQDRMGAIISEPWQRKLAVDQGEITYEEQQRDLLGEETYDKVRDFRDWLDLHPQKFHLLNYLNRPK